MLNSQMMALLGSGTRGNAEMTEEFCAILDRAFSEDFFSYIGKHSNPPSSSDNFTKMKKQYAEIGLGRSNTRFGWMRTRA